MNECRTRVWQGTGTKLWFWGCSPCGWFEGGYPTEDEANEGRERHGKEAEDRRRRRAEVRAIETVPRISAGLLGVPRAGGA